MEGRGRLLLAVGEAGMGKTRLAEELSREARAAGARVLWGRAWERGGAPPYWPWVQVIRACLRGMDDETIGLLSSPGAAYLGQLVPEIGKRIPDLELPEGPETDQGGILCTSERSATRTLWTRPA
jgi:predicted ATPase